MGECIYTHNCNKVKCKDSFCVRRFKIDELYEKSLIPPLLRKHITLRIDADGTDYEQFTKIVEIENNILSFIKEGKSLFLHSPNCGNGKTSSALRIAESYILKIWAKSDLSCKVLFVNVPRYLLAAKARISNASLGEYADLVETYLMNDKPELVIWDDIAYKSGSDFDIDKLLALIESRDGKSNIYTSNLNINEIRQALDQRLASRISKSVDIEFRGSDKRALLN